MPGLPQLRAGVLVPGLRRLPAGTRQHLGPHRHGPTVHFHPDLPAVRNRRLSGGLPHLRHQPRHVHTGGRGGRSPVRGVPHVRQRLSVRVHSFRGQPAGGGQVQSVQRRAQVRSGLHGTGPSLRGHQRIWPPSSGRKWTRPWSEPCKHRVGGCRDACVHTIVPSGVVQTLCRMCETRCAISVQIKDGVITDITPWEGHPVNRGRTCSRERGRGPVLSPGPHPDPPETAGRRTFTAIPYDQALDEIASRMADLNSATAPGPWAHGRARRSGSSSRRGMSAASFTPSAHPTIFPTIRPASTAGTWAITWCAVSGTPFRNSKRPN